VPTLLARQPTDRELLFQGSLKKFLPSLSQLSFSRNLCRSLGLESPAMFFAAILSLISHPPAAASELGLLRYLLEIPEFYLYLSDPEHFDHDSMLSLCRTLMRYDARFDVKLVSALADAEAERELFLRALSILDETSPGGRLTMTLARVSRDAEPAVASKLALLMGKRISNPEWIEKQLTAGDPRIRANVLETLWDVKTDQAKKWLTSALNECNNRALGNALVGLHKLEEHILVDPKVREIAVHPEPPYRATAAWVMGQTGNQDYRELVAAALEDADQGVRDAAQRAMGALDKAAAAAQRDAEAAAAAAQPKPIDQSKVDIALMRMRLNGTYGRRIYSR
jgi:hypothetical protein